MPTPRLKLKLLVICVPTRYQLDNGGAHLAQIDGDLQLLYLYNVRNHK